MIPSSMKLVIYTFLIVFALASPSWGGEGKNAYEKLKILENIHNTNKIGVAQIVRKYSEICSEYQTNKQKEPLRLYAENFISTELRQGKTPLTVVIAGFACPGFGHPWTGSSGSPTYFVVGNVIFSAPRSIPSFYHIKKHTVILNWHHGSHCETTKKIDSTGVTPCFSALYWSQTHEKFLSYNGSVSVKRLPFQ